MASQPFRSDGQQHHSRPTTDEQASHWQHHPAEEWHDNPQGGVGTTSTPEPPVSHVLRLQVMLSSSWFQTPRWEPPQASWFYNTPIPSPPPTLIPPPAVLIHPPPPPPPPPIPAVPPPTLSHHHQPAQLLHTSSNTSSSRGSSSLRNCISCSTHAYCINFSDACNDDHAYCRHCFNHFIRLSCGGGPSSPSFPSSSSYFVLDDEKEGIIDRRRRVPPAASASTWNVFPPRCCGQPTSLPDDALRLVLDADVFRMYMVKRARSRLPWRERTHCAAPDCGTWLTAEGAVREDDGGIWKQQQKQDQGVASRELRKCSRCEELTCTACKQLGKGHLDGDGRWKECPVDEEAMRLDDMADGMKWTRCGGCGVWVEHSGGCSHIVCRCGYEFCFVCGSDYMACPGHKWNPRISMENEARRNTTSTPSMRDPTQPNPLSSADPFRPPPTPSSPVIARTPRPPARSSTAAEPPTPTSEGGQDLDPSLSNGSAYWYGRRTALRTGHAVPTSVQEPLYFGTLRSQLSQSTSNNHRTISRLPSLREWEE